MAKFTPNYNNKKYKKLITSNKYNILKLHLTLSLIYT